MASNVDPSAPRTWVAIDIAKGWNVALVEHADGRQQRFRFRHCCEDYDGLMGSTPILRTLSLRLIMSQRSVHVEAQALQP